MTSPTRHPRRWTRLGGACAVLLAAALLALWLSRPTEPFDGALAEIHSLLDAPEEPTAPPRGLDASLEELRASQPGAVARAEAAHCRLPALSGEAVHAFHERLLERSLELDPDWAIQLGVHPHPTELTRVGPEAEARALLLARDAWEALAAVEATSAHERADLAILRASVELNLRWDPVDRDAVTLTWLDGWCSALVDLAAFDCCPEADRLSAARARLEALPASLDAAVGSLRNPPAAAVESALRRLPTTRDYLADYAREWAGGCDVLQPALAEARAALADCERRLKTEVLGTARGAWGVGADNYALLLKLQHHVGDPVRSVLRRSLQALRAERERADALAARLPPEREVPARRPEERIQHLASRTGAWVATAPERDPGLRLRPTPLLWDHLDAQAFYLAPGPLGPRGVQPYVLVSAYDEGWANDELDLVEQHVAVHETYPGHHLQSLYARESSCELRLVADSRLLIEGWAVYAEDLYHRTSRCGEPVTDKWLRAGDRLSNAWNALVEGLIHTRWASPERALAWARAYTGDPELSAVDLYDMTSDPSGGSTYFLGREEIARLRALADARGEQPRAFHERLLRAGPAPPRLLQGELFPTDRD